MVVVDSTLRVGGKNGLWEVDESEAGAPVFALLDVPVGRRGEASKQLSCEVLAYVGEESVPPAMPGCESAAERRERWFAARCS